VKIHLNGEVRDVADGETLESLVAELGLDRTVIAVELNREVVGRGTYAGRRLGAGDRVEIVTLVGGG
jgi:sulfur carrier protein